MTTLFASLFAAAVTLSGLPEAARPAVVLAASHHIDTIVCGQQTPNCGKHYQGLYHPKVAADLIVIREALPLHSVYTQSIIVHEYVHYLQYMAGKFTDNSSCSRNASEHEAYSVQAAFLALHGIVINIPAHITNLSEICNSLGEPK